MNYSPAILSKSEQVKPNSQPLFFSEEKLISLEPQGDDCFLNSMIGFASFPIDGDILSQVMK